MKAKNKATQVAVVAIVLLIIAAGWTHANAGRTTASSKVEPSISLPSNCGSCVHHSGMLANERTLIFTGTRDPITHGEFSPSIATDGMSLYFGSARVGNIGFVDIWVSHRSSLSASWGQPENLGPDINSPFSLTLARRQIS